MIKGLVVFYSVIILSGCSQIGASVDITSQPSQVNSVSKLIDEKVLMQDFKALSSAQMAGRKSLSKGSFAAQDYLENSLVAHGVMPFKGQYRHPFTYEKHNTEYQGTNIIGFKQGTSEKYIVVTAHYDHLGVKAGKVFYGADDNASGTAAVLNIAKAYENLPARHNIIYLFTDAEEQNLIGAFAFAEQFPVIMDKTLININIDMIAGARSTKRLYYLPYQVKPISEANWLTSFSAYASKYKLQLRKGPPAYRRVQGQKTKMNWRKASDHGVFYANKIPFIYYGVGVHNNYHTTKDTFENTNHVFYKSAVYTIFDQLYDLEQQID